MNDRFLACPPAIGRHLERLQFTLLDSWRTGEGTYRFRCAQGHVLSIAARSLPGVAGCARCREAQRMARLVRQAEKDGSQCLDPEWQGGRHRHHFQCLRDATHEWRRAYANAVKDGRCPRCSLKGRGLAGDGLQRLQAHARSRGGECLSPVYVGMNNKHQFCCEAGHVWWATGHSILMKATWCSRCVFRGRRLGLGEVQRTARTRGGEFLSAQYLGYESIYSWRCAEQHTWQASYKSVQGGNWCPLCSQEKRRLDPDVMHELAAQRGGRCWSTTYRGADEKYLWECANGHRWLAALYSIKQGGWCPRCRWLSLDDLRKVAAERGGQCLSRECHGSAAKYQWLCGRGHQWSATYSNVRTGHWCPACAAMARARPGSVAWRRHQDHLSKG